MAETAPSFPSAEAQNEHYGDGPSMRIAMTGLRGLPATVGGVERVVDNLSRQLVTRGHEVTVYGRQSYVDPERDDYEGVRLRCLPQIDTKHFEAASHTLFSVLDVLRRGEADILHIHATGPALFSVLPRLARFPTVVTIHGLDFERAKWGFLARQALRLGLRTAATVPDRTIAVSEEIVNYCARTFDRDVAWIPNGINEDDFAVMEPIEGLEPDQFLLFLGRLVPEKGVHTLLEAYARTDIQLPLVVAGSGTHTEGYVAELERLAAKDPRVRMLGPVFDARKAWLLRNTRATVLPSTLEGMPLVLLEAGICERPCIVSDIPEHLAVVREGSEINASVFRTEDVGSLAETLVRCLEDPLAAQRAADLKHTLLREYDWPTIATNTQRVYREVLAAHSTSTRRASRGLRAASGRRAHS